MKNRYTKPATPTRPSNQLSTLSFVLTNRNHCLPMRRGEYSPRLIQAFGPIVATEQGALPPGFGVGSILLDFEDDHLTGNIWLEDLPRCTLVLATTAPKAASLWQFILDVQDEAGGPEDLRLAVLGQRPPESLPWLAYHAPPELLELERSHLLLRLNAVVWALGWAALDRLLASQTKN